MLRVDNLTKFYQLNKSFDTEVTKIKAVDNVCLEIKQGKTLGLVGESGCGKSTLARIILKLISPTSGSVFFKGNEITGLKEPDFRPMRKKIQIVFQDPYSSLSPRLKIKDIIAEPLLAFKYDKKEIENKVEQLLKDVGLNSEYKHRLPHQLSGGERQRVGIARALATSPELMILDESVSSLDLSTQAQVLNLLCDLQKKFKLTFLFIAHNLDVVRYISDQVAVMYKGAIVELADVEELYDNPLHPYTKILLASMPGIDKKGKTVEKTDNDANKKQLDEYNRSNEKNKTKLMEVKKGHFVRTFEMHK
jgi:ABC-type oligopeptide transport system ATPase subunit